MCSRGSWLLRVRSGRCPLRRRGRPWLRRRSLDGVVLLHRAVVLSRTATRHWGRGGGLGLGKLTMPLMSMVVTGLSRLRLSSWGSSALAVSRSVRYWALVYIRMVRTGRSSHLSLSLLMCLTAMSCPGWLVGILRHVARLLLLGLVLT